MASGVSDLPTFTAMCIPNKFARRGERESRAHCLASNSHVLFLGVILFFPFWTRFRVRNNNDRGLSKRSFLLSRSAPSSGFAQYQGRILKHSGGRHNVIGRHSKMFTL
jgi:hypothetical protein